MEYSSVELQLRKMQALKEARNHQILVKIGFLTNETDCQLGFKIIEFGQLYTFGYNVAISFILAIDYISEPPCVLQLSLVASYKGKKQEVGSYIYIILNDYYGCENEAFEAILLNGDREMKVLIEISIFDVIYKNQYANMKFDLIAGREQEQFLINSYLSSSFRQITDCMQQIEMEYADPMSYTFKMIETLLPGISDDFQTERKYTQVIGMYTDMLNYVVEGNYYEAVVSDQFKAYVIEIFDAMFLPYYNILLYKDVILVPLDPENQSMRGLCSILEYYLAQNYYVVPVYIHSAENYSVLVQILVLFGLLYNIFRVLLNMDAGSFAASQTLHEWLTQQSVDDVRLEGFNRLYFAGFKSDMASQVDLKYYVVDNSFVLQTHLKVLFFNLDEAPQKAPLYESVYSYNSFSRCNSLEQISMQEASDDVGKVLLQVTEIVYCVSKLLRVPATQVIPAVVYTVPVLPQTVLSKLADYSHNTADIDKFAQLLYLMPCKLGNLAQQLGQTSKLYQMAFLNTKWIFALYCLLHAHSDSEVFKLAYDIFTSRIQYFLANKKFCYFRPLSLSISGREIYYKNKAASAKVGNTASPVTKLVKTKHVLSLWESLAFQTQQEVRAKVRCLRDDNIQLDHQHEYFQNQLITNQMGYCAVFDYAKCEYAQRLTNQLRVGGGKAHFAVYDEGLPENEVLVATSASLRFLTYFLGALQCYKRLIFYFQLKKDEYVSFIADDLRRYSAEEFTVEAQDYVCILVAYM